MNLQTPSIPIAPFTPPVQAPAPVRPELLRSIDGLRDEINALTARVDDLARAAGVDLPEAPTRLSILQGYVGVLVVSFLVTLIATPLLRRLAIANGIIDIPKDPRKIHKVPVAYLGGAALFLGLMGGVLYSFLAVRFPALIDFHATRHLRDGLFAFPVPLSVLLGMTVIVLVGLIDDVVGLSPRVKIGGQLFAAAALAIDDVGVKLAGGLLVPLGKALGISSTTLPNGFETILFQIPLPFELFGATAIPVDVIYWIGTGIIAVAVLGLCNASNLIDGLDGLNSGVHAIAAAGLCILGLGLALSDDGPRDTQRIVLCMALMGACLGFLPHNFNPATIFLGDAGSLLNGFCAAVIILMMGDTGRTDLVIAGLIIYAVPIIDTSLAIVRRKMEGKSISAADDQHLHHMLKRALGVKGAVLALYAMAASFATLGVTVSLFRARVSYVLALLLASFIGVTAIKIARRRFLEAQTASFTPTPAGNADAAPAPTAAPASVQAQASAQAGSAR